MYVGFLNVPDYDPNCLPLFPKVEEEFPVVKMYRGAWPVILLARQFMNNKRANDAKLKAADAKEGTSADITGPNDSGSDGDDQNKDVRNDDSQNENVRDDVTISDIDD